MFPRVTVGLYGVFLGAEAVGGLIGASLSSILNKVLKIKTMILYLGVSGVFLSLTPMVYCVFPSAYMLALYPACLLYTSISGPEVFQNLRALCLAGETFPSSLANRLRGLIQQGCRVFNLYGPSETTIYATYYELKDRKYNTVPIGKPLPGVQLKIASQKENSKMAELLIGGNGVTEGYRLQPELNKAKFKLIGSNRYYVTGDYVYYQGDNRCV